MPCQRDQIAPVIGFLPIALGVESGSGITRWILAKILQIPISRRAIELAFIIICKEMVDEFTIQQIHLSIASKLRKTRVCQVLAVFEPPDGSRGCHW